MNIIKNAEESLEAIPVFAADNKNVVQYFYHCGSNDNNEVIYKNPDAGSFEKEVESYHTKLMKAGYRPYSKNRIGDNRFATYVKKNTMLHCNYFPAIGQFRVVYGSAGYLPEKDPVEYNKAVDPSISMLPMSSSLCMIYQGIDGSFPA